MRGAVLNVGPVDGIPLALAMVQLIRMRPVSPSEPDVNILDTADGCVIASGADRAVRSQGQEPHVYGTVDRYPTKATLPIIVSSEPV